MFETLWSAQTCNCFYYACYLLTSSLVILFDTGTKSKLHLLYEAVGLFWAWEWNISSPHRDTHTHSTFMELLKNCNGPTSRGLFNLHYALEISLTHGVPMSVPIPVPLPPNIPNRCNLGQRLMAFSSQADKSFSGSTVQLPKCPCPPAGHSIGSWCNLNPPFIR